MNLAIVILNYNGRIHLENYIENIISYSKGHDLIIADNASNDDSVEYIKQFNEIQLIEISSNLGFAGGYNEALKRIQGKYEYYLLLNSDVEVSENWITPLISAMDNKRVAACQPKIKSLQQKGLVKMSNFRKSKTKIKYIYKLTPYGIAQKTTLTINFMKRKMKEYEELKSELKKN